jgi:glutathione S-transferase
VPVLEDGQWYRDSFDIARHADARGSGERLLPADRLDELSAWNARSEAALAAGRAMFLLKAVSSPAILQSILPKDAPAVLRPLLLPIIRRGLESAIQKYRMRDGEGSHERTLLEALDTLAAAVSPERPYLLGRFSYADIAMALVLQSVRPVDETFMPVGLGGPENWTNPRLAERYAGLLQWRDALYAKHRRPASPGASTRETGRA